MKKFVILDPSIKKRGGHYLEYATRVLDAAGANGYETLVVANKACPPEERTNGHRLLPWFSRDVWENGSGFADKALRFVGQYRRFAAEKLKRARFALQYNRAAIALDLAFGALLDRFPFVRAAARRCKIAWGGLLGIVRRGANALSENIARLGRLRWIGPTLALALSAVLRIVSIMTKVFFLLLRSVSFLIASVFILPFFLWRLIALYLKEKEKPSFAHELITLMKEHEFSDGDVMFVPTTGPGELAGVTAAVKESPKAKELSWRLLYRRDLIPERRAPAVPATERPQYFIGLRDSLRKLRRTAYEADIAFYTDTDELSRDYNLLGVQPFKTVAVPVDPALRHCNAPPAGEPLSILYIGDVRNEKGFPCLPNLIEETLDLVKAKKIRYVVQSNFNLPEGEDASAWAMESLKRMPDAGIEFMPGPLSPEQYRRLIEQAGVVLVPYRRENYVARSSGIFAEAVAAGAPCLVTAGTWMARLAEPYRQERFAAMCSDESFRALPPARVTLRQLGDLVMRAPAGFSEPARRPGRRTAGGTETYCIKLDMPDCFSGVVPMRLVAECGDGEGNRLATRSQTAFASPGRPVMFLLDVLGREFRLRLEFPLGDPGVPLRTPATLGFCQWLATPSRVGGIGIAQDESEFGSRLRDLVENYESNRAIMRRAADDLWPLFDPAKLAAQLTTETRRAAYLSTPSPRVLVMTDVAIGYGSPQVPSLAESFRRHFGAQVLILERDEEYRPPQRPDFLGDDVVIERLFGGGQGGRNVDVARYAEQAMFFIEKFKPDILATSFMEPLLFFRRIRNIPKITVLQYLECGGGGDSPSYEAVRRYRDNVDRVIFPERNRARLEMPRLGLDPARARPFVMHNSRLYRTPPPIRAPEERNGRFIYAGGLWLRTNTLWLLDERLKSQPIDVFGGGSHAERFRAEAPNWLGYVPSDDNFFKILSEYAFSLILWSPDCEETFYCAPNKMYDALACGVPFVAGPHPLCLELAGKYRCGIVADGWGIEDFIAALKKCHALYGTEEYAKMTAGCRKAMERECDWETQFRAFAETLPPLKTKQETRR